VLNTWIIRCWWHAAVGNTCTSFLGSSVCPAHRSPGSLSPNSSCRFHLTTIRVIWNWSEKGHGVQATGKQTWDKCVTARNCSTDWVPNPLSRFFQFSFLCSRCILRSGRHVANGHPLFFSIWCCETKWIRKGLSFCWVRMIILTPCTIVFFGTNKRHRLAMTSPVHMANW
jgi:hypothetical protein